MKKPLAIDAGSVHCAPVRLTLTRQNANFFGSNPKPATVCQRLAGFSLARIGYRSCATKSPRTVNRDRLSVPARPISGGNVRRATTPTTRPYGGPAKGLLSPSVPVDSRKEDPKAGTAFQLPRRYEGQQEGAKRPLGSKKRRGRRFK